MNLSHPEKAAILQRSAELVAERILAEIGPAHNLQRLPVPVACHLAGVSRRALAEKCRIIKDGPRSFFILLGDYKTAFLPHLPNP